PADAPHARDVSASLAAFLLVGPRSDDVLAAAGVSERSESECSRVEIGYAPALVAAAAGYPAPAWMIVVSTEFASHAFEALEQASGDSLRFGGSYALDAMRLAAGEPAWPSELDDTMTPFQAGVEARIAWDKPD